MISNSLLAGIKPGSRQLLIVCLTALIQGIVATNAVAQYADKVLVIVNEDVITQSEFEARKRTVLAEINQPVDAMPSDFAPKLLDGMISDRLQLQEAVRRSLEPGAEELDFGFERYLQQQGVTQSQFLYELSQSGQSVDDFKNTLKDTISLSRLRDYYARARVIVPDYEIDGWLAVNGNQLNDIQYNVAHLLIKDPVLNRSRAEAAREQIVNTGDFASAAARFSDATDAPEGGLMGWRRPEQLPDIFLNALKDLQVGGVTPILESPNGLHILKLVDLRGERTEILQHRVSHVLINAKTAVARAQAVKRLNKVKELADNGEPFANLARINSDDSVSAAAGGDLGWVSPGEMVYEFEQQMVNAKLNEVSSPFSSQFGVHILLVEDRRNQNITDQMQRRRADSILRRQRVDREFNQWVRDLREQAYIEHVSEPV
ncbi:MAG: peptidylprolyl isomerase [Pseudomonadota bacterium]